MLGNAMLGNCVAMLGIAVEELSRLVPIAIHDLGIAGAERADFLEVHAVVEERVLLHRATVPVVEETVVTNDSSSTGVLSGESWYM